MSNLSRNPLFILLLLMFALPASSAFMSTQSAAPQVSGTGQFNLATQICTYQIATISVDGTDLQFVTRDSNILVGRPSWSPDGETIAASYARRDGSEGGIVFISVSGELVYVPLKLGFIDGITWSPDAETVILSVSMLYEGQFLFSMPVDGSRSPTQLTFKPANEPWSEDRYPAWSPDGTTIAFARLTAPNTRVLWLMDPDGTNLRSISPATMKVLYPTWAPDGQRIAFSGYPGSDPESLWVIDADGENLELISSARSYTNPNWSPDGGSFAFVGQEQAGQFVEVWSFMGGAVTILAPGLNPEWAPDGSRLAFEAIYCEEATPTPTGTLTNTSTSTATSTPTNTATGTPTSTSDTATPTPTNTTPQPVTNTPTTTPSVTPTGTTTITPVPPPILPRVRMPLVLANH